MLSRRKIFKNTLALLTVLFVPRFFKSSKKPRIAELNSRNIIHAGMTYTLPKNPYKDQSVYLHIDCHCLKKYPIVRYEGSKILGDDEDLVLDSIGNINLVFKGDQIGWKLG